MRIMGLDFGSKTVGVAVCDELGYTAQGVETTEGRKQAASDMPENRSADQRIWGYIHCFGVS